MEDKDGERGSEVKRKSGGLKRETERDEKYC